MEGPRLIPNMYSPLFFSTLFSFLLKDVGPVRSSIIVDEIQKLLIHCCIGIQNGVLNICSLFDLLLMSQKFGFGPCYVGVPFSLSLPYSLSLCERWFNLQLGSTSRLRASLVQPTSSNQLGSPALIQPFSDHHRVFVNFQIRFADSRVSCSI